MKRLIERWRGILAFFGFGCWGKVIPCTPVSQRCPIHQVSMKRAGRTYAGSTYYCPKCRSSHFIAGGGTRVIKA